MEPRELIQYTPGAASQPRPWPPTPVQPGRLTIVIPVREDACGLERTLRSLLNAGILTCELADVVVVSDIGSRAVSDVCRNFPVHLVPGDGGGSYAARNLGARHGAGEYLAFLDADVEVADGWFTAVQAAMEARVDYGAGAIAQTGNARCSRIHNLFMRLFEFPNGQFFVRYHFFPTANLLIRREILRRAGGFDARLRSGGDLELGARLAGEPHLNARIVPAMDVRHPTRPLRSYLQKVRRQASGHHVLGVLFPERFPLYRPHATVKHGVRLLLGWRDFSEKLATFQSESGASIGLRYRLGLFAESRVAHAAYLEARVRVVLAHTTSRISGRPAMDPRSKPAA